jgi:hypothetical protein
MARPAESRTEQVVGDGRNRLDQPPVRLGGGGRQPVVVGIGIALVIGIAIWQPWSQAVLQSASPTGQPAALPAVPASDGLTSASASPSATTRPAPSHGTTPTPGAGGTAVYTTITDNEWTVVALLAPAAPASTEEPATQHPALPWSADGPFLVLQQGLTPVAAPVVGAGSRDPCPPVGAPRDRTAVPLPAGRVAYLGITIPPDVPRPQVTAARLGQPAGALARVPAPTVRLAGMDATARYIIPTAGPGAAVLFTGGLSTPRTAGAYQFTVASPGAAGDRYLSACIAP